MKFLKEFSDAVLSMMPVMTLFSFLFAVVGIWAIFHGQVNDGVWMLFSATPAMVYVAFRRHIVPRAIRKK